MGAWRFASQPLSSWPPFSSALAGVRLARSGPSTSLHPSAGSGGEHVFTVVFSHPKGAQYLEAGRLLINEYADGRHACYVQYVRPENAFILVNDSGEGSTRMKAGDAGALSNSQCSLAGSGSSASLSGSRLKLLLDLRFKRGFVGKKQVFTATRNIAGEETEFRPGGSWNVTADCTSGDWVPSAGPVAPASGGGSSATFTFTYSLPNGPSDLIDVRALFNRTSDGASACYVAYDRATDAIRLADDAGQEFSSIPLKSGLTVGNSQCNVSAAGSSVWESRSSLVWKLPVTFKPAFAGRKNIFLYALGCNQSDSGMRKKGTWAVPYGSP